MEVESLSSIEVSANIPKISLADLDVGTELGRGYSGIVYRVKILPTSVHAPQQHDHVSLVFKKFHPYNDAERELYILNKVFAPHLISPEHFVYEGTEDNIIGYTMKRMESLSKMLQRSKSVGKQMPLEKVVQILHQTSIGLFWLHDRGIAHCDIKPGNVLISLNGEEVNIADYGSASENRFVSREGSVVATTAQYCAPEILKGETFSVRSDMYSFGVMGKVLLGAQQQSEIPEPRLRDLITRCLARTPSNRPTIMETRVELEEIHKKLAFDDLRRRIANLAPEEKNALLSRSEVIWWKMPSVRVAITLLAFTLGCALLLLCRLSATVHGQGMALTPGHISSFDWRTVNDSKALRDIFVEQITPYINCTTMCPQQYITHLIAEDLYVPADKINKMSDYDIMYYAIQFLHHFKRNERRGLAHNAISPSKIFIGPECMWEIVDSPETALHIGQSISLDKVDWRYNWFRTAGRNCISENFISAHRNDRMALAFFVYRMINGESPFQDVEEKDSKTRCRLMTEEKISPFKESLPSPFSHLLDLALSNDKVIEKFIEAVNTLYRSDPKGIEKSCVKKYVHKAK